MHITYKSYANLNVKSMHPVCWWVPAKCRIIIILLVAVLLARLVRK